MQTGSNQKSTQRRGKQKRNTQSSPKNRQERANATKKKQQIRNPHATFGSRGRHITSLGFGDGVGVPRSPRRLPRSRDAVRKHVNALSTLCAWVRWGGRALSSSRTHSQTDTHTTRHCKLLVSTSAVGGFARALLQTKSTTPLACIRVHGICP